MNDTIHFLIFGLEDRSFGLRLSQVQRVVRSVDFTPLPQAPGIVLGVIDLHGQIVPLLDVRARFGFESRPIGADGAFIIAQTRRRTVALAVDAVSSVIEYPRKRLEAAAKALPTNGPIDGVVQDENSLALIHDLDRLLSLEEEQLLESALMEQPGHGR